MDVESTMLPLGTKLPEFNLKGIDEKYYQLVIDTHLSSINAGAEVILTNTFTTRKVRMEQNQVGDRFHFANQKACELAIKAKELSKKNILILENYIKNYFFHFKAVNSCSKVL